MRVLRLLATSLLALGAFAAPPVDLDALISAARSAPAEFSADALIRISGIEQVASGRKIELLEQAFDRAAGAQQPFKRHATPLRNDGSVGYWNRVDSQDLDALSLRLRAVEAMLPLDARRARERFARIPTLQIPRITCDEYRVYDVARFYEVLGKLVQQGFTAQEVEAGEAVRFLARYTGALSSAVQASPLAKVIAASQVKDADFQTLVDSFGKALGNLSGDDRSFAYTVSLGRDVQALAEQCKRRKLSPLPLLEGYRVYLIIHLSAARCADDDVMVGSGPSFGVFGNRGAEEPTGDVVTFFNEKLQMPPLHKIEEVEATPSRLEGTAAGARVCQDEDCQKIAGQMRGLLLGDNGTPYSPAEREKPEWQARLRGVLAALSEWKRTSATTPEEFFREKSAAYGELLTMGSNGSARDSILHALLGFVSGNQFQTVSRAEWFLPVNGLVGRVGLDPLGLGTFAADLRKSSDPVVALYADLEALAPRPPDRILTLL